jgi:CheY-like chemotaxis protein
MLSGSAIDGETVVLIVENSTDDKDMLIDICREVGFTLNNIREVGFRKNIQIATELEKAVGILNRGEVDLVLLDLALNEEDDDPMHAVLLLEKWKKETRKKKIPVIVVSGFTEMLKQAALQSCAAVIRKPGPTDGEKAQFSAFLQYAIRTAITRRSDEATLGDRIRQQFERIGSRIGSFHLHVGPGISVTISRNLPKILVAVFLLASYAVALIIFAKSQGWPIKTVVESLSALLLAVILWAVITTKRSG